MADESEKEKKRRALPEIEIGHLFPNYVPGENVRGAFAATRLLSSPRENKRKTGDAEGIESVSLPPKKRTTHTKVASPHAGAKMRTGSTPSLENTFMNVWTNHIPEASLPPKKRTVLPTFARPHPGTNTSTASSPSLEDTLMDARTNNFPHDRNKRIQSIRSESQVAAKVPTRILAPTRTRLLPPNPNAVSGECNLNGKFEFIVDSVEWTAETRMGEHAAFSCCNGENDEPAPNEAKAQNPPKSSDCRLRNRTNVPLYRKNQDAPDASRQVRHEPQSPSVRRERQQSSAIRTDSLRHKHKRMRNLRSKRVCPPKVSTNSKGYQKCSSRSSRNLKSEQVPPTNENISRFPDSTVYDGCKREDGRNGDASLAASLFPRRYHYYWQPYLYHPTGDSMLRNVSNVHAPAYKHQQEHTRRLAEYQEALAAQEKAQLEESLYWEDMFRRLKAYKEEHGVSCVNILCA